MRTFPALVLAVLVTLTASNDAQTASYPWGPAITTGDTGQEVAWGRVHFDPTDSRVIWAATSDLPDPLGGEVPPPASGIYKSTDAGSSWAQAAGGALNPDYHVLDFSICKANPDVVYAATLHQGVFRTTSGGGSWTKINNGISHNGATFPQANWGAVAIAVDPANPNNVCVSVGQLGGLDIFNLSPDHPGMYYSRNGGNSWTSNNAGLPPRQDGILGDRVSNTSGVLSLAIAENSPSTIYAGVLQAEANIKLLIGNRANAQTKVFKNTNGGIGTWVDISNGLPTVQQNAELGNSLARIAASAVLLSVVPTGANSQLVVASSLAFGVDVNLGTQQTKSKSFGLYALPPGAGSWVARNQALPVVNNALNSDAINTTAPAIHPDNPYIMLTGVVESDDAMPNSSKIWATTTAGAPWLKNWGDSGLNVSPTEGLAYCNPLFIEIAPNASRAIASIAWTDDVLLSNDDDGIYMVPAP